MVDLFLFLARVEFLKESMKSKQWSFQENLIFSRLVITTKLSIVYDFSQHLINLSQSEIESLLVNVPNKQYLGQYHWPSAFSAGLKSAESAE